MRLVIRGISSAGRPTREGLKAAQLRDLEVGVGNIALLVEEDLDLAVPFQAGDGIDGDAVHDVPPFPLLPLTLTL